MNADVIVIGGGIAGLATARELLQAGASVTIIERDVCGREASWAGAGILSPLLPWDYSDPVTELTKFSNRLFPAFIEGLLAETGVDPEYQPSGMLVVAGSPGREDAYSRAAEDWCTRRDYPFKEVNSSGVAPALAINEECLWLSGVCQVRNPRLLQALTRSVRLKGGVIIELASVTELKTAHGNIESISTSQGNKFSAGCYVVTAGA